MKNYRWIAALALLLVACQSTPGTQPVESQQPAPVPEVLQATEIGADVQEAETPSGAQEPEAPAAEQEVEAAPTPAQIRQGLAATDPASVNLANGTPTFVEFFAFW